MGQAAVPPAGGGRKRGGVGWVSLLKSKPFGSDADSFAWAMPRVEILYPEIMWLLHQTF
jgi:hypothetical protein